jgi:hypothetical protein
MQPNISQATAENDVIEISSDDESEPEVKKENDQPAVPKKRALSNSATGPPNK